MEGEPSCSKYKKCVFKVVVYYLGYNSVSTLYPGSSCTWFVKNCYQDTSN